MAEEPEGDVGRPSSLVPETLGFMCGIEVHQQLATGKLHSRQSGELYDITIETLPDEWPRHERRLRATQGEGGAVDVAARFESKRNRTFVYAQSPNAGLIELDDQPPMGLDEDAVEIALTVSALLGGHPVSTVQTMRKTVVDGSNTSGFQRTSLMATDGVLVTEEGEVGIDVLCLEEDSARKLDTVDTPRGQKVLYNLDRLGLPLIEIATSPDIRSPDHAQSTAMALGRVLRQTRRVRRGLGSIRQDLNVSIAAGDRVEIKGCQDLAWIPTIVRLEMARQLHFYRLANTLRATLSLPALPPSRLHDDEATETEVRERVSQHILFSPVDVSEVFTATASSMISGSMGEGSVMLAQPLPGLLGHLGSKTINEEGAQQPRLGRELAGAAKLAGVKGIFHADELPAYGITEVEVNAVRSALHLQSDDAFVLCCAPMWQAMLALESVVERARLAWHRIPQEVRNVVVKKGAPEDGTTSPMRPLPGRSRMYPETDVPPLPITADRWANVLKHLPMTDAQRAERLASYDSSEDQRDQMLARELDDVFCRHADSLPHKAWAALLLNHEAESPQMLADVLRLREEGVLARDHIEGVVEAHAGQTPGLAVLKAYCEANGLAPADAGQLADIIQNIVASRLDFVQERGMGAMGPLMGVVMQEASGADGKEVSALLKAAIQAALE